MCSEGWPSGNRPLKLSRTNLPMVSKAQVSMLRTISWVHLFFSNINSSSKMNNQSFEERERLSRKEIWGKMRLIWEPGEKEILSPTVGEAGVGSLSEDPRGWDFSRLPWRVSEDHLSWMVRLSPPSGLLLKVGGSQKSLRVVRFWESKLESWDLKLPRIKVRNTSIKWRRNHLCPGPSTVPDK